MNKKAGRKTVITPYVLRKLKEAFLLGCTDREACLLAGISETALYDYQGNHQGFTEQKNIFKANPILKARQTVIKNLDDPKVAMWFLERRQKAEFSPKVTYQEEIYSPELTKEEKETLYELLAQEGYEVV